MKMPRQYYEYCGGVVVIEPNDEFKPIPGYSKYLIDSSGRVFSLISGRFLNGHRNRQSGYYNYSLINDDGKHRTEGRHRLMGMAFKPPKEDVSGLVVNHENGIKGDDFLDNLTWTTHTGNIEHAGANNLTDKCKPIEVRNIVTGEVLEFASIRKCADHMGLSKDSISYRLKFGPERVYPEKAQYRFKSAETWDTVDIPEDCDNHFGRARPIVVKFLRSYESELVFTKACDFCNAFGHSEAAVSNWLKLPNQPVLPGYVQIKFLSDRTPWRDVEDMFLELDSFTKNKSVIVHNHDTKKWKIYPSARQCAAECGLTPTALDYRLNTKLHKVFSDNCSYDYYLGKHCIIEQYGPAI